MKGYSGASTIRVPELFMRASLAYFDETWRAKQRNNFVWF
jgi:hypothetical protein